MKRIKTPPFFTRLKESRAVLDIGEAGINLARNALFGSNHSKAPANARPVLMFPGFMSDDRFMWPLRSHLQKLGYQAEGWGLGANLAGANYRHTLDDIDPRWGLSHDNEDAPAIYNGEAGVPLMCDKAIEKVRERSAELHRPMTLVGWSLGGYIAREVARELQDEVAHVITFGAPVIGGPKYTSTALFFKARGFNLDWMESEIAKRDSKPIQQPITAIYSKSDGIVAWEAMIDHHSPNVEHIEVDAAHLGMGFNGEVWKHVTNALAANSHGNR